MPSSFFPTCAVNAQMYSGWMQGTGKRYVYVLNMERIKNTFRKMEGSGSLNEKLNAFMFMYRITVQSATGMSPGEPLM